MILLGPPPFLFLDLPADGVGLRQLGQGPAHRLRTRVVRVAGQVLLQAGGEFIQSVRLFHGASMRRFSACGIAKRVEVFA